MGSSADRNLIAPGICLAVLRSLHFAGIVLAGLGLGGCSVSYVAKQASGQLHIVMNRTSIDKLLKTGRLTEDQKEKLRLVLEAKAYAEETIGLTRSDNYLKYHDTGGKSVAWNLSASPRDALAPKTWWFPIVGTVPYLGYFDREDGEIEERRLKAQGYDTCLRGVRAYSTLGWFTDPVFSPMLEDDIHELVNTIVHELTHGTVYASGQGDFNESFATFVGNQGGVEFLAMRFGADSAVCRRAREAIADDAAFGEWIADHLDRLRGLYASDLASEEKIHRREFFFRQMREGYTAELKPMLKTADYDYFPAMQINNAVLLGYARYMDDLALYEKAYESLGRDLRATVLLAVHLADEGDDPKEGFRRWLKEDPATRFTPTLRKAAPPDDGKPASPRARPRPLSWIIHQDSTVPV
ncbi:MAG: aminopeptidase [Planctomycetes bacterium]|nr:aminopeptidase [Planctomycetota bacterium]